MTSLHRLHNSSRQMLSEAVSLCRSCWGYWFDEYRAERGEQVEYAVDTDVLVMHLLGGKQSNYATVFSGASGSDSTLARSITSYLFLHLPLPIGTKPAQAGAPQGQLLMLPPHDEEIRRKVVELVGMAVRKGNLALSPSVLARFRAARKGDSDPGMRNEAIADSLVDVGFDLMKWLDGESDDDEGTQIARLNAIPDRRLAAISMHAGFTGAAQALVPPLTAKAGPERKLLGEWYEFWCQKMGTEPESRSKKGHSTRDDAWALAHLQWLNSEAVRLKLNRRFVLVTGTERIHAATENVRAPHGEGMDFAEAYIRDPRSLIGARDFFSLQRGVGTPDAEFRVQDWMSVLFPNAVSQERVFDSSNLGSTTTVRIDEDAIEKIARGSDGVLTNAIDALTKANYVDTRGRPFPDGALAEWSEMVSETAFAQTAGRATTAGGGSQRRLSELVHAAPDEDVVETVREILLPRMKASFEALYRTIGALGTVQLLQDGLPALGLPALRFDDPFYQAQARYGAICDALWARDPSRVDLTDLFLAVDTEDKTHYHAHVIHAFIYASQGRWAPTRTLCRIALLTVDLHKHEVQGRLTGREAAYLMAIAERRLAKTESDLGAGEERLENARRRALRGEDLDIRFDSERLAQRVAREQFRVFTKSSSSPGSSSLFADLIAEASRICEAVKSESEPMIRRWVMRQGGTNGLLCCLIASMQFGRSEQVDEFGRGFLSAMRRGQVGPAEAGVSGPTFGDATSEFVFLVAASLFSASESDRDAARRTAALLATPAHPGLMYEATRRERFLKLAGIAGAKK